MADSPAPAVCHVCHVAATMMCSRCKSVRYCGREHQRQDWKQHKRVCRPKPGGAGAGAGVSTTTNAGSTSTCTRCLKSAGPTPSCRVTHPVHLTELLRSSACFSTGESTVTSKCLACSRTFSTTSVRGGTAKVSEGPAWCYSGPHTVSALPSSDTRRAYPHVLKLVDRTDLQERLNALPISHPDLEVLIINPTEGRASEPFELFVALPALKELRLELGMSFDVVHLTEVLTPNVERLVLNYLSRDCDLLVRLPKLRSVKLDRYECERLGIQTLLDGCPRLEEFESYKLYTTELRCAGNWLKRIRLHRSDTLKSLTLFAPRLEVLNLQGVHALERIEFPTTHRLAILLPPDFVLSKFVVDLTRANLSDEAMAALEANPRVTLRGGDGAFPGLFPGMGPLFC